MNSDSLDQISTKSASNFLRSPVLENLKLEDPALSVSESSENEEECKQRQNQGKNHKNTKSAGQGESPHEPPDLETQEKLLKQLEFYFSDENLPKDQFLLKHLRQNKSGYVSLKLLATFKRVQKLTKDWRDLRYVLCRPIGRLEKNGLCNDQNGENSPLLELNNNRTKVRRSKPLPDLDDAVHDRTIVVFNYQTILKSGTTPIESITEYFSGNKQHSDDAGQGSKGVLLVRLVTPGSFLPDDLKPFQKFRQGIFTKPCALVEFQTVEMAQRALQKFDGQNDWRGMQVQPLKLPEKKNQIEEQLKSQPKKYSKDKQQHHATLTLPVKCDFSSVGGTMDIPTGQCSPKSFSQRGVQHQRPASPQTQRMAHQWEAARNPTDRSPCASVPHMIDHSPLSCSPSSLGNYSSSPWLRKRMLVGSNSDLANGQQKEANRITVVRQPKGPDGTRGFRKSVN